MPQVAIPETPHRKQRWRNSFEDSDMKNLVLSGLACLVAIAIAPSVGVAQENKTELAKKAHEILKTNCYRCHGQDGTVEGDMYNYVIDLKTLVSRKKVLPGNAAKSKIIQRIILEEMPPEGEKQRPSEKDIVILKQWINSGAADIAAAPAREFIAPEKIIRRIQADLLDINEKDCRFVRYFTITHLYNAGFSEDELQTYRNALSKLLNSLSWGRKITKPHPIDPAKTIFRIDLRDYKVERGHLEVGSRSISLRDPVRRRG